MSRYAWGRDSRQSGRALALLLLGSVVFALHAVPAAAQPESEMALMSTLSTGSVARKVHQMPRSGYSSTDKVVALTFDDGPHSRYTPQVLKILADHGVRGAFFFVGKQANRYPDLVKLTASRGHGIGGHTWDHVNLKNRTSSEFSYQVDKTNRLLATLPDPDRVIRCVRPPYGAYDSTVVDRLGRRGITTAIWTVDPKDWKRPGASTIVSRVLGNLHNGAVILFHDGGGDRSQTVAALPEIIRGIKARGYRIVPVCNR
jgi:peptidoglycan-N-acetylglucosamine deacetylase